MAPLVPEGPNAEQIRYWNDAAAKKWVVLSPVIDAQVAPLGREAMERAGISPGDRVLDIGCGCGLTTLEIARRVAPGGSVAGADISGVMLEQAGHNAAAAGNVSFENVDAQLHRFSEASFDVVFSRFGVMFFAGPEEAFANVRRALRADGRLAFVCWQPLSENPWMLVPLMAALPHLPPMEPPQPGAPGPFAFGDPDRVRRILETAGFADIRVEPLQRALTVGGGAGIDGTVDFLMQMGPTGSMLRQAGSDLRERVAAAIREAVAPYLTAEGVRMPSAAWLVSARNP